MMTQFENLIFQKKKFAQKRLHSKRFRAQEVFQKLIGLKI